MTNRKTERNRFMDEFMFYYARKVRSGRKEIQEDRSYFTRLGSQYYDIASANLSPGEFKRFFDWLVQEEPYFVDEHRFKQRIGEWCSAYRERKAAERPPDEFMQYISLYALLAWKRALDAEPAKHEIYRRVEGLVATIESIPQARSQFTGLSDQECYAKFFRMLQQIGVSGEILATIESDYQTSRDDLSIARESGDVMHYYMGRKDPREIVGSTARRAE